MTQSSPASVSAEALRDLNVKSKYHGWQLPSNFILSVKSIEYNDHIEVIGVCSCAGEIFTCFLLYCGPSQPGRTTLTPRSYSPLRLRCLRGCWDLFGGAGRLPWLPWLCPSSGRFLGAGCLLSLILQMCLWRCCCLPDESSASAAPQRCSSQTCFGPLRNKITKRFSDKVRHWGDFNENIHTTLTFKGELRLQKLLYRHKCMTV